MIELKVLGSGSAGNCYIIDNGKEALVIECGMPFKEVQKAVDFDINRIAGAIVTHEHGDHAKFAPKFLDALVPVYMSAGTAQKVFTGKKLDQVHTLKAGKQQKIGNFTIMPFAVEHDAAEPLGFLINHEETGTILFATDTAYLRYKFANLSTIMIECNYSREIMDENSDAMPKQRRDRTIESHCSLETCKEILLANDLSRVFQVILIHLSDGNSNAKMFKKTIEEATGKDVFVAEKGLKIELYEFPF